MSKLDTGPKASSTAVKPKNKRFLGNYHQNSNGNDTFNSMFSEELTINDLVKRTFSDMPTNKSNIQMDSMYSSLSGQSSLGILELDNMSDIGNTNKKDTYPFNLYDNRPVLQHRLSQAAETKNTLVRARSTKSVFDKNIVNEKSVRNSLTNITNAFNDMLLKEDMIDNSFSDENFISGSEFKENLAEIEEVNRKEFGSLSESRFNFSLEGEKQSIENGSFVAKYFATKSIPVEDLSIMFPKRQNKNETFTKEFKKRHNYFLNPSDNKDKQEEQTPIGYKTMSSITSWTDSHVSNNLLNLTTLSDISEVLTSKPNSIDPKELVKALLSREQTPIGCKTVSSITSWTDSQVSNNLPNLTSMSDVSEVLTSKTSIDPKELVKPLLSRDLLDDKQLLNEPNKYHQRRFSTSTRFTNSSLYLEHAEISFPSSENLSLVSPQKKKSNITEDHLQLNKNINIKENDENKYVNAVTHYTTTNKNHSFNNFDEKQTKKHLNNSCYFNLTPKNGYFENCMSETNILDNNIDLSNFSVLTNNHDITEVSLNKFNNVSKMVYCNEKLCQDKLNQSQINDYKTISEVLEIGDICIGTYSQAVITLENHLNICAKFTLNLLDISLNYFENKMYVENKPIGTNIATVLCSNKICSIPPLSEASFTIGIIPLISGNISIYVKLESNDISQKIYRNIQVHSFVPQITWVNNSFGSIDFGLLPELSKKSFPIKLLNKGSYQVPIKIILNQDQSEDIKAKAVINPSELWQCDINILTPSISKNNLKTKLITGRLQIVLDSVEELSHNYSPLLYCSNLSGRVGFTNISFDQNPLTLKKHIQSTLEGVIEITNNSELPISLFVKQKNKNSEFTIQPDQFQLAINEKAKMKIVHLPSKSFNYFNETSICLQIVSSQKQFFVKINCIEQNPEFQQSSLPFSRPISPWSTSSSSAVGQLELESTCSSLVWGSVPSNTKSVQNFTLRNRGSHKEKLLLSIKDNKNCFKLISSGGNQISEMKLLLEPMESQKLNVALISTSNEGQAYGQLTLQRIHSNEKRVISLFGYCGHSVVVINGTFEDNFGNMWLYSNSELMTAQFSITNSGNTTAFVKVFQENSMEDLIQPNEFLLKKGETTTVEVTIVMSPERLEMLIEQDSNSKVININKISLIYGDEVSRVRVLRIWNKIKNEKKIVYPDQQHLDEISNMFNGDKFVNVDHLQDSEKSLFKLWKMGISQDSISILMEKSNLELLLCETTTVFSELETTVISRLP